MLKCLKASDSKLGDTELVEFSRQLHRLLTRITSGSAQLVVRRNVELNGFETWRLLTTRNCTGYQFTEKDTGVQVWDCAV